jgi:hypothetical protein
MSDHDSLEAFYRGCGDPACEEHRQPEPWKYPEEAPDGTDSPASGDGPGAAVPVGDEQGRAPVTTSTTLTAPWTR